MTETFREWVEGQGGPKNLISFAGHIYPIIRNRVEEELSRNLREISQAVAEAFCDACLGTKLAPGAIKGLWEFQLSPAPISLGTKRLHIGSLVVGYQFPEENRASSKMTPEEREKFVRERAKIFQDYIRNLSKDPEKISDIVSELVDRIRAAVEDKQTVEGNKAQVIWSQAVTTNKGTRNLGSLVIAHRLSPMAEKELEKALTPPPIHLSAKDSEASTRQ